MKQETCAKRINGQLESTMEDLRTLWALYCEGSEEDDEDLGNMYEYGLSFDYVAPGTFNNQADGGYFRYQLSWGGPSSEFRFYTDKMGGDSFYVRYVEFVFLDWWDGATRTLGGDDLALLKEIFSNFFVDSGTALHQWEMAIEDN